MEKETGKTETPKKVQTRIAVHIDRPEPKPGRRRSRKDGRRNITFGIKHRPAARSVGQNMSARENTEVAVKQLGQAGVGGEQTPL